VYDDCVFNSEVFTYVDLAEIQRPAFDFQDKNGDGVISRDESTHAVTGEISPDFLEFDENNDGVVTFEEWIA